LNRNGNHPASGASRRERAVWACSFACALLLFVSLGYSGRPETASTETRGRRAPLPAEDRRAAAPVWTSHIAIADFDGDLRPDVATVESGSAWARTSYRIRFELSTGAAESIGVTAAAGGLQIWTQDVNGDSFPDLMISTKWLHEPVAILLNDGHGKFTVATPGAFPRASWEHERNWNVAADPERAELATIGSRSSGDELEEISETARPQVERTFVLAGEQTRAKDFARSCCWGRAPPA
jgi:hypothetical protein